MYLNITHICLLSNICINKNVFALKPHSGPRIDFMFCHRFVSDRMCDEIVHKKKESRAYRSRVSPQRATQIKTLRLTANKGN